MLHRHDLFFRYDFSTLLLLRDPHCGGLVRGTGPRQHKHIERTRAAYKQDASPTHTHTPTHTTHTKHTKGLSLITWRSALLDLLHFTFFLDYPLSQTSYHLHAHLLPLPKAAPCSGPSLPPGPRARSGGRHATTTSAVRDCRIRSTRPSADHGSCFPGARPARGGGDGS